MENLNAETVKKALECCVGDTADCNNCPYWVDVDVNCFDNVKSDALALIKELTKENRRLSFFNEQKAEAVRYEAITKYKKSIIDYYNNDSRYDRPNAHTLLVRLFALLDEKAKEILEGRNERNFI